MGAVSRSIGFDGNSAIGFQGLLTGPESVTGEALKNIRTMIGFAADDKPRSCILLTSTIQGEGKTFLAINLAIVVAQLGAKVLLIEGDLRRPTLHQHFGLPKEKGLSHFLAHWVDASELDALVHNTGIANLSVLHCGAIPPNPSELLSTPRLKAVLAWDRKGYDQIFIDGTPMFPITDALIWSH